LKRYKSPGTDELNEEEFQAGGKYIKLWCVQNYKIILNKEDLPKQWNLLFYLFILVIKLTVIIRERCHYYQLHTTLYPTFSSQSYLYK